MIDLKTFKELIKVVSKCTEPSIKLVHPIFKEALAVRYTLLFIQI